MSFAAGSRATMQLAVWHSTICRTIICILLAHSTPLTLAISSVWNAQHIDIQPANHSISTNSDGLDAMTNLEAYKNNTFSVQHQQSSKGLGAAMGRSLDSFVDQHYFDQINARNHRPVHVEPMLAQSSETHASLAEQSKKIGLRGVEDRSNPSVHYYSPNTYSQPSGLTTPHSTETQQSSSYVLLYPSTTPATDLAASTGRPNTMGSSGQKVFSLDKSLGQKSSGAWSIPLPSNGNTLVRNANTNQYERGNHPTTTYPSDLNKLLQKYYNRDLSSMSEVLSKHSPDASYLVNDSTFKKTSMDVTGSSPDEENVEESDDEETGEDNVTTYAIGKHTTSDDYEEDHTYGDRKAPLYSEAKSTGKSGDSMFRVSASNPTRLVRQYSGRSALPLRLQTSHSHSMPHYYLPHNFESGHHHHISLPEKSGTWLGSGLAAGILIGAIPFGIMMASMMPTLLTGAMPIVNTAAVGKRRRRREATSTRNLLFDQTFEGLGILLRKGLHEVLDIVNEQASRQMAKNSQQPQPDAAPGDMLRTVARYALAAVDEPKCIKEMLCSLVASGRHAKTTPLQKTLYVFVKWIPKDIERSLGLNGLFSAVRKNACFATYKCPASAHKRSSTVINARKMT